MNKVEVINCVTSPEIEILYIIALDHYDKFKNRKKKNINAKEYTKTVLKISKPNNTKSIKKFFSDPDDLVNAILEYSRVTKVKKGFTTIAKLIK
ncbi:MAG: hypothetical protein GX074_04780 [Erysipelothrix sp.]|nr:hypothetical protein [Erysipelothrix sp.]